MIIRQFQNDVDVIRVSDAINLVKEPCQGRAPSGQRDSVLVNDPWQVLWADKPEAVSVVDKGGDEVAFIRDQT